MAVYVDEAIWPFRGMVMCHMFADTEEELNAMADKIGVARKWIQRRPGLLHYDIAKAKRALAVKAGAIQASRKQVVLFMRTGKFVVTMCDPFLT